MSAATLWSLTSDLDKMGKQSASRVVVFVAVQRFHGAPRAAPWSRRWARDARGRCSWRTRGCCSRWRSGRCTRWRRIPWRWSPLRELRHRRQAERILLSVLGGRSSSRRAYGTGCLTCASSWSGWFSCSCRGATGTSEETVKGERGEGGAPWVTSGDGVCSHQFFATVLGSRRSRPVRSIASHCRAARAGVPAGAATARDWACRSYRAGVAACAPSLTAPCSGAREAHPLVKMETSEQEEQEIEMEDPQGAPRPPPVPARAIARRSRKSAREPFSRPLLGRRTPPRPAHPRPAALLAQLVSWPDGGSRQRHVDDQSRDPP